MALLHRNPFKALYILLEILTTVVFRVPYWVIYSIPKSNRPRQSWAVSRCVFVYGLRRFFLMSYVTGGLLKSPDHRAIGQGKNVHGVWVNAAPDFVKGSIRERAEKVGMEYVKIPGYWFVKKGEAYDYQYKPTADEKVVYSFHGGGYVSFSAHPSDPLSPIRQGIIDHTPNLKRLFSLEYRISKLNVKERRSVFPFPTALVDAIAGYNYLVNDLGYTPENIILEGDSAGANLALALTRYLIENPLPNLPPPGGMVLNCPWVDLSLSHITPGSSSLPAVSADVLPPTKWGPGNSWYSVRAFVGMDKEDLSITKCDPYISPACLDIHKVPFTNFPKTLIVAGDAELFIDATRTLYRRMMEDMGDRVELYEVPDVVHDYMSLSQFEPERTMSFKKTGEWISAL
ncbi:hypothetical protein M422DRAFT_177429 [Sphaerobolus stellatus SS14]|uniref:Alpha/beta hydrolase fold-3 domain-containing protein n=1 Tax=Sphaerobolus stellatus (strain SS14) TaxID=990650 RepID=A0A0C9V8C9_SPHS4|nr:hypothetical protein M422DRAFT_177547 [Sphaerobolus stellatus SS14]KIJ37777.1 hypothetical protein M422DRAFT_177429 [Sphaerobolus stellatus SS14]